MADLSHWVYATDFTGHEAAYLILGVDPSTSETDNQNARHIKERMKAAYMGAFGALCFAIHVEPCFSFDGDIESAQKDNMPEHQSLKSVEMQRLVQGWRDGDEISIEAWIEKGRNEFIEQRFSRLELSRWIEENGLVSKYRFDNSPKRLGEKYKGFPDDSMPIKLETPPATIVSTPLPTVSEPDIDPSDLPPELDAAMLAFRAVSNGFGDANATFRNRLIEYLQTTYPTFKTEQVQRIATVANADPTPGRKKRDAE